MVPIAEATFKAGMRPQRPAGFTFGNLGNGRGVVE